VKSMNRKGKSKGKSKGGGGGGGGEQDLRALLMAAKRGKKS
jgi:hypothetical protein